MPTTVLFLPSWMSAFTFEWSDTRKNSVCSSKSSRLRGTSTNFVAKSCGCHVSSPAGSK